MADKAHCEGFSYYEIAAGHDVMVTDPSAVVGVLLAAAAAADER
jgi:hypothetical protein